VGGTDGRGRERLVGWGFGYGRGVFGISAKDSWATSSACPPPGPMANPAWGGPQAGWISGGEVGSPMWARMWVMGSGSVRNAIKVIGSWHVGQISGKTS
jgi:hypothetical protein